MAYAAILPPAEQGHRRAGSSEALYVSDVGRLTEKWLSVVACRVVPSAASHQITSVRTTVDVDVVSPVRRNGGETGIILSVADAIRQVRRGVTGQEKPA
jgi:hypothetical protein